MKYWRDNGTPVHKMRMGFAAYGRTFRLTSSNTGIGAPASGGALAGPYTSESGVWSYYEVKFEQMHTNTTGRYGQLNNPMAFLLCGLFRSAPS